MSTIIILGYGKMGRAVERVCQSRGLEDYQTLDSFEELQALDIPEDSVVIEFTCAPDCLKNYKFLIEKNIPVVTGTTGWLAQEDEIRSLLEEKGGRFLYAANFSIGVHLFWHVVEQAARIFNHQDKYDVYCHEVHHPHKADSPSGTALHTAQILLDNIRRKTKLVSGDVQGPLAPELLHFAASRGGYQFGEHTVTFDGPDDTITVQHHAKSREGFANGAVDCALWLRQHTRNGYLTINDYLEDILT